MRSFFDDATTTAFILRNWYKSKIGTASIKTECIIPFKQLNTGELKMLILKHTLETSATPTQIWRVWENVETWKEWDHEIEFSKLDGPFKSGVCGQLKMLNSPIMRTQITKCDPLRMYVIETKFFLAKSVSTSIIEQIGEKTYVTFINEIRGPLACFYMLLVGRNIKEKTPHEMQEMLKKASSLEQ